MRRLQTGPPVWRAGELRDDEWCVELDDHQRRLIVAATEEAAAGGATFATVTRDTFLLDGLADAVARWSNAIARGRGLLLLRGFPIDLLDPALVEVAYAGLCNHFGTLVPQNAAGELLTHIRDDRLGQTGPHIRKYRTNERQDFHTDGADVIALLCLHRARTGGESMVVSSLALYNELLRRRPDLLEVLYLPFHWDRQGDDAVGDRWFRLAPINDLPDGPRLFYLGWYIRDAQRHQDVPRLTPEQHEAIELLEEIANDPTFHIEMDFRPGDVQLLNNGRILHAREAFEDDDDPDERRHLLRAWMAAHGFTSLEEQLRFGITTHT
ncbi:MAG: TauD/TfdA family dioxygenase [Ilumatobacteraceae bacterium]